jgi:DNA-binding transcriptional ArsR family regulator
MNHFGQYTFGVGFLVTLNEARREAIFRCLADPTRRRILRLLRDGESSVGDLAGNFRTSRPAISKHLRVLESAGLVVARQEGTSRLFRLDARPLRIVNDWLQDYESYWGEPHLDVSA